MWSVIDIETHPLPTDEVLRFEPAEYKLGNVKDEQKKLAAIQEKRAKFIEDATLDAKCCFIQAIGYWSSDKDVIETDIIETVAEEADLLRRFWHWFEIQFNRGAQPPYTVTEWRLLNFMLRRYDMPMIIRRSWKHGISVPKCVYHLGKLGYYMIDIADQWSMGDHYEFVSLKHLSLHLGVGDKDGSELFWKMHKADPVKAQAYLVNDVKIAVACATTMNSFRL